MIRVFQCEDNLTGILTGVYDAWNSRLGHENVRLALNDHENLELFCEYEQVVPDVEKAGKVFRTIQSRLGEEACGMIAQAAACPEGKKADAIYRMIVIGLHMPHGTQVKDMLTQPQVRLVFELSRKAGNIAHRYKEFVRFRELENGVLFSEIDAEADVLALIAPHFADRLPLENWTIYDRHRKKAAVHPCGKPWFILEDVDEENFAGLGDSGEEAGFQELWKGFFRVIGIESRANKNLQMSFLPLKFRSFMTEFD